jgi:hypothetical protein
LRASVSSRRRIENRQDDACIAAVKLSERYISDRFLPDKAIDLMDEAAAKLRMERDSVPEELDEITRRLKQLEIEREAIKRENDTEKIKQLDKDIAELRDQEKAFRAKWESEKGLVNKIQQDKQQMEQLKFEAERAEREGNYERVAEIRYGRLKALEEDIRQIQNQLKSTQGGNAMIREEVTADDIAEVVSRWTGIPVTRMMQSEREKLLHLEEELHRRVIGQDEVIKAVSDAVRRSRAEEYERSDRSLRVLQSGTRTSYGVAHGFDSLVLSDYAAVQLLLKVQQLLAFALHHARNGYSRPAAYHLGYVVGCHLLAYHGVAALRRLQLVLYLSDVLFKSLQSAVAYLSHALVVALALGALSLELQLLHLLLVLLNLVHQALLALPFSAERLLLVAQFGDVLVELLNLLGVVLALDSLALNLELLQSARNLVEFLRYRVALHAQLCSRLVHEVDSLVWQEAVGDVTLRKLYGSYAGIVLAVLYPPSR